MVGPYGDGLIALNHVVTDAPALLVIDCNLLDEEVEALLAAVKVRSATTQCVVLIRSSQRTASGADAVVPHDGSMSEFMAVLARFGVNLS